MDKDRIIGSGKQIMGSVKEVVGRLIGDAKLQTDGRAEQREERKRALHRYTRRDGAAPNSA